MEASSNEFIEKLKAFARENLLILALACFGLIFLGSGLIQLFGGRSAEVEFERGKEVQAEKTESRITVDVSGEVLKPGVYHLAQESRIQDALIAAGGLSANANRDYISKYINLAQKVADGSKIYIPRQNEVVSSRSITTQTSLVGGISSGSKVNINSASLAELDSLSGIGPVTAQKIVDGRAYSDISELVSKSIISKKTFDKIKDQLTVY